MAGTVAILEDSAWKTFFSRTEKKLKNPNAILATAYATVGYKDIISHFQDEAGPSGKWTPSKRVQRSGGKTLQDTGNLRQSITPTNYRNETQAIRVFAAAPYGGIHDRGGRNMPQRSFMWLSKKALSDMAKIVLHFITQK